MLDQAGDTFLRAHPILTGSAVITLCWLAAEGGRDRCQPTFGQ